MTRSCHKLFSQLCLLLTWLLCAVQAQTGSLHNDSFHSPTLQQHSSIASDLPYLIYLPPGYEQSQQRYPVIYLLHGSGESEITWTDLGDVATVADGLIAAGRLPPSLLVMPTDHPLRYTHQAVRPRLFEQVFVHELVEHIDSSYRTLTSREARGIAGVSFNGYEAVFLAFTQPETFGAVASLSAPFWTPEDLPERFRKTSLLSWFFGSTEAAATYSVYTVLPEWLDADNFPKVFLLCGDDDAFLPGNLALFESLQTVGVASDLRVVEGDHRWRVWRAHVGDVLEFFADEFENFGE